MLYCQNGNTKNDKKALNRPQEKLKVTVNPFSEGGTLIGNNGNAFIE